jgi:hypothetical protein
VLSIYRASDKVTTFAAAVAASLLLLQKLQVLLQSISFYEAAICCNALVASLFK